jgi:hypothetical protein
VASSTKCPLAASFSVDGVEVDAKLEKPLSAITHVGFCTANATTDFSPLEVRR